MNIRHATPRDSDAVRQVSARSCRVAYEEILDDETLIEVMEDPSLSESIREWLEETEDDDHVVYLVALDDAGNGGDGVVGFAQLLSGDRAPDRTDADEAYLKSLYVHPDSWGQGVGSELLETGIERLSPDITHLSLAVLTDNDIGREFYENHGFEQVDTGGYEVEGTRYETVIYEKSLRTR